MSALTVAEAKNRFSDLLRRAQYGGERVIVERHGKPVAAIVSTDDLRRLESAEDAADLQDARAALAQAKAHGTVRLDRVLRKYGLGHLLPKPERAGRPRRAPKPRARLKPSRRTPRKRRPTSTNRRRR